MPDVFTDEVGTYDLTITTTADWTVSSGGMPNGDNYVTGDGSIAATYNLNGDDFDFRDGTAWTIECWLYYTTVKGNTEWIMSCGDAGTTTEAWWFNFNSTEVPEFTIRNTVGGNYLLINGAVALSTSTWHHIVVIKETGNTLKLWIDNTLAATTSATTGTARTPTGTYRLYFGTRGDGTLDITSGSSGMRVAKLAIYNAELTPTQINEHYLAMTA